MEQSIENLITTYMGQFKSNIPDFNKKVSGFKTNDPNLKVKLMALYRIYVEKRGGLVRWDEATMNNIDSIISWLMDEQKRWLLLYGSVGNGKTTMLNSLSKLIHPSVVYSAQTIFDEFKDKECLIEISEGTTLFIDDLGAEPEECRIYGERRHPLAELLQKRYLWNATTIIVTNLTLNDIQNRYGGRVYDRMLEMAASILYDGPSYRERG